MPGLHIDRFRTGLVTNRAPITTPFRVVGNHTIALNDALIDGLNVEISPSNTLVRRPGWTKYCTATYGAEVPNGLAGANLRNPAVLKTLLSTNQNVYDIGASTLTSIYTKATTAQTFFQQVGSNLFMSDGNANIKWNGIDPVTNNGIATPTVAPTIPNLNLLDAVGATQTVHAWVPNYTYTNATASAQTYFLIASTGELQMAVLPAGSTMTSQGSAPNWSAQFGVVGGTTKDGTVVWANCGPPGAWKSATAFTNSSFSTNGQVNSAKTGSLATSGVAAISWSTTSQSAGFAPATGVTGNTNTLTMTGCGFGVPAGATIDGIVVSVNRASNRSNSVSDVTVQLLKAGVGTGSNKASAGFWPQTLYDTYIIPVANGVPFSYGSNKDLWGTTWTPTDINNANFGVQFVANQNSTRTTTGALVLPITITVYYHVAASDVSGVAFSTIVLDTNGNLQAVKTSGTSGGGVPTWSTTVGGTTADNTVTWQCLGTGNQLPCLFSWTYAYGFHTSSAHLSTMSPVLQVLAPIVGNNVNVKGFGSNDTQTDRVDVYRTPDGGSLLLFNTSAANVNSSTSWTISDNLLDVSLNALLVGPVAHANDPPPAGMTILAYHMGRMWGLVGNLLYFSAGPDCTNGDGNQAWPPANVFVLTAPGTALAPTTQGLVVVTGVDISAVLGGPQLNTFWLQPLFKNLGVQSPNCLTQDGDEIIMLTSQQQVVALSASGRNEFGFEVAGTAATNFPAASSYITVHRAGQDQGIFLTDNSAKQFRFNMNAEAWDPIGQPVNGIGPVASIDIAIGTRQLLSTAGGFVVFRDVNTFSDAGTAYAAFGTVGSIVLSPAGEPAASIKSIVLQSAAVGTGITISVLPNEISGSFTNIPKSNSDPWQLPASSTINMDMYQWAGVQAMLPNLIKHLQTKITFPATDTVKNEIYSLSFV